MLLSPSAPVVPVVAVPPVAVVVLVVVSVVAVVLAVVVASVVGEDTLDRVYCLLTAFGGSGSFCRNISFTSCAS